MRILPLIALFSMSCPTCERDWREKKSPSPWKHEWDYVCVPTGRSDDAQVTIGPDDSVYKVWSRGGGYGEFETFAQAKAQGEKVVKLRKLDCP